MENKSNGLAILLTSFSVIALILGGIIGAVWFSTPAVIDTKALATDVANQVKVTVSATDLASINTKIDDLSAKIDASDLIDDKEVWETEAVKLATDELSSKKYKELYNYINSNASLFTAVDEREDISKVIITDTETDDLDEDDKDAVVTFELKVYYEDINGDEKKVYIDVETEIADGEVEEQTFSKH